MSGDVRVVAGRSCVLWLGLLASGLAGCSTPMVHEFYRPVPIENDKVRVELREVNRGARGGVITLELTNLAGYALESAEGAKVTIELDDGETTIPALDLKMYECLVDAYGPIAMGFEKWSKTTPPVMLDPVGSVVNLEPEEHALMYIAFEADDSLDRFTLDLSPALFWRTKDEVIVRHSEPILLTVPLPKVPNSPLPSKDAWRHVHFGVAVSSDDFNF